MSREGESIFTKDDLPLERAHDMWFGDGEEVLL